MKTFRNLKGKSYTSLLKEIGIAYLGGVSTSHKTELSEKAGTLTYGVYLAPWNLSGRQVCAGGKHCHDFCLHGSGNNKADILAHGAKHSHITQSRIKKTRLFYENRLVFMFLLVHEIKKAYKRAKREGKNFAVRINCTSDLSPEIFVDPVTGKNILEIFPNVQFYDYTKVSARLPLIGKYNNYDLTFSFDGYNSKTAKAFLSAGGRVAVVFDGEKLPVSFAGYQVINGNNYDMRFDDPGRVIVGLSYHKTANDYKVRKGKRVYIAPDTPFVIKQTDKRNIF